MPTQQQFEIAYVCFMQGRGIEVLPNNEYLRMLNAWKLIGCPAEIEAFIAEWVKLGATNSPSSDVHQRTPHEPGTGDASSEE
ncbi:MAG TPA: hypothetical protein VM165_08805 [Planctomycetaceae bacterium]|nr:hypothetical protein [Planctomycetaceae bacterium]